MASGRIYIITDVYDLYQWMYNNLKEHVCFKQVTQCKVLSVENEANDAKEETKKLEVEDEKEKETKQTKETTDQKDQTDEKDEKERLGAGKHK